MTIDTYGTDVHLRMAASGAPRLHWPLGVLKYFYLSLPLLLVQIFIDFGYTIGLIFGASSMHHRSSGAIRWCLFWQPLFHGRRPAADGGPHRHSHKGASIKTALTSVGPLESEETTGVWFEIEPACGRPGVEIDRRTTLRPSERMERARLSEMARAEDGVRLLAAHWGRVPSSSNQAPQ